MGIPYRVNVNPHNTWQMVLFPVNTDLVKLLKNLVECMYPLAEANQVAISFKPEFDHYISMIDVGSLSTDLSALLSQLIIFTPQEHSISIQLKETQKGNSTYCQIRIRSMGATLELPQKELEKYHYATHLKKFRNGTQYTIVIEKTEVEDSDHVSHDQRNRLSSTSTFPAFYKKFRKQLRSHIPSMRNLEMQTMLRQDREGLFVRKVNSIIQSQIENEDFDTVRLARALAMSRSQLYRKLKPVIRQSPGTYIRYIRLERAKELLLQTALPVGEIGPKIGFPDPSHFSRAFKNQYGFNPSQMRSKHDDGEYQFTNKMSDTNEPDPANKEILH